MNTPKVSVIIPVYNEERYLAEALDSVLGQSLKEIEVICVDAGSSDRSVEILREYAAADSRLKVSCGHGRLDAGTARNIGLDAAGGEYLSFLDADDLFHPDMLAKCACRAEKEQSDIVVFAAQQLDMRTNEIKPMPWSLKLQNCPGHSPFAPEEMAPYLLNSFQNWTWNKLFRGSFVRAHGIRFQAIARTNDMAFTCEALARAGLISVIPEAYVTYRVGTGTSLQQTNDVTPTAFWEAYKDTKSRLEKAAVYQQYERSFLNTVLSGTVYNLKSVKTEEARQEVQRLICQEETLFGIRKYPASYYYSRANYRTYLALLDGKKTDEALRRKPIDELIQCCADHGIIYTLGYGIRKLRHRMRHRSTQQT